MAQASRLLKLETQDRAKDSLVSTSLGARITNMLSDAPAEFRSAGYQAEGSECATQQHLGRTLA